MAGIRPLPGSILGSTVGAATERTPGYIQVGLPGGFITQGIRTGRFSDPPIQLWQPCGMNSISLELGSFGLCNTLTNGRMVLRRSQQQLHLGQTDIPFCSMRNGNRTLAHQFAQGNFSITRFGLCCLVQRLRLQQASLGLGQLAASTRIHSNNTCEHIDQFLHAAGKLFATIADDALFAQLNQCRNNFKTGVLHLRREALICRKAELFTTADGFFNAPPVVQHGIDREIDASTGPLDVGALTKLQALALSTNIDLWPARPFCFVNI